MCGSDLGSEMLDNSLCEGEKANKIKVKCNEIGGRTAETRLQYEGM